MPKYRNTVTGLVVDVPDEPTTRTDRPMREKQWTQQLALLAKSKRWKKVPDSTRSGMPKTRPSKAKLRRTTTGAAAGQAGSSETGGQKDSTGSKDQKDA